MWLKFQKQLLKIYKLKLGNSELSQTFLKALKQFLNLFYLKIFRVGGGNLYPRTGNKEEFKSTLTRKC